MVLRSVVVFLSLAVLALPDSSSSFGTIHEKLLLGAVHDFYAHSNWADQADPRRPIGIDNPPGLNRTDRPTLLAFLLPDSGVTIPPTLTTGCFELSELVDIRHACKGRVRHRDLWNDVREHLVRTYPQPRADVLICTLVRDDPIAWCERHVPRLTGELLSTATRSVRDGGLRVTGLERKCVSPTVPGDTRRRVATQTPAPGALVVRNAEVTVTVCTSSTPAPAAWTGAWTWKATRTDTGAIYVAPTPMTIVQQGQTVCSVWGFSGGGSAKGGLSGSMWNNAAWYDGFGKGTWNLTLAADGRSFRGSQTIDPHGAATAYAATIAGSRVSSAAAAGIDCKTLKVGP